MQTKQFNDLTKEELIEYIEELKKTKKFGIVWESKPERIVEECKEHLPVLEEVNSKSIKTDDNKPTNLIIEGDNYHSLSVLNYTHAEKIDVIYIDPPYNTGNATEWKYNDKFIDKNDTYRHSKWINMMHKRLTASKNLLKPGGSILISIGDDELGNLKLLCDKVFGIENFITVISRIAKTASNKGKFFAPSCDYVLLYTKTVDELSDESFAQDVNEDLYKKEDENGKYRDDIALYQSSLDPLRGCKNQRYYIEAPDGSLLIPPGENFPDTKEDACFIPPKKAIDKVWRWSYATYLQQKHLLVFKQTKTSPLLNEDGNQAKYNIYTKSYLKERQKTGVKPRNFLIEKSFLNRKGADYIKKMGLNFNYSKPKALINHLIKLSNADENAIILDFFAGSGTTGEVVLDLNTKDNGNRKFILCTNNEVGFKDEKRFIKQNDITYKEYLTWIKEKNPKVLEFIENNGVASSVCYPRMKYVIEGYIEKSKAKKKIKGLGGNLKYFKTSFVPKSKVSDDTRKKLVKKSVEMICVKEDSYENLVDKSEFKIFKGTSHTTGILFNLDSLESFKKQLQKYSLPAHIYVFSLTNDTFSEDFEDLNLEHKLCPIPESILEVYRKLFKN